MAHHSFGDTKYLQSTLWIHVSIYFFRPFLLSYWELWRAGKNQVSWAQFSWSSGCHRPILKPENHPSYNWGDVSKLFFGLNLLITVLKYSAAFFSPVFLLLFTQSRTKIPEVVCCVLVSGSIFEMLIFNLICWGGQNEHLSSGRLNHAIMSAGPPPDLNSVRKAAALVLPVAEKQCWRCCTSIPGQAGRPSHCDGCGPASWLHCSCFLPSHAAECHAGNQPTFTWFLLLGTKMLFIAFLMHAHSLHTSTQLFGVRAY